MRVVAALILCLCGLATLSAAAVPSTETWMSAAHIQAMPLRLISLPGTHDSGTHRFYNPGTAATFAPAAQTQVLNIAQQLRAGVRHLDLRVQLLNGSPRLGHTFLMADSLRDVFNQVLAFATLRPTQIVIVRVQADAQLDPTQTGVAVAKEVHVINAIPPALRARLIPRGVYGAGKPISAYVSRKQNVLLVFDSNLYSPAAQPASALAHAAASVEAPVLPPNKSPFSGFGPRDLCLWLQQGIAALAKDAQRHPVFKMSAAPNTGVLTSMLFSSPRVSLQDMARCTQPVAVAVIRSNPVGRVVKTRGGVFQTDFASPGFVSATIALNARTPPAPAPLVCPAAPATPCQFCSTCTCYCGASASG